MVITRGTGLIFAGKGRIGGNGGFKLLLFPSLCLFSAALQMQYVACREADMGWWVWTKGSVALGPRGRGAQNWVLNSLYVLVGWGVTSGLCKSCQWLGLLGLTHTVLYCSMKS